MRILFVMDPVERLDLRWDTSLYLLQEFAGRNHETWAVDASGLWIEKRNFFAEARHISPRRPRNVPPFFEKLADVRVSSPRRFNLRDFDLILLRKDPPVDDTYLYLTHFLERIAKHVPVSNNPHGIRNTNEKLATLLFPKRIPETLVTSSSKKIMEFQKRLRDTIVVKPLDERGGRGVFLLKQNERQTTRLLQKSTRNGKKIVMAQKFLKGKLFFGDKRILILNGNFLAAFEKHPNRGEFRANLGLGGTFHPTHLSAKERQLVRELKSYLLKEGLHFVGIDVRDEKLLEINVTSPAGLVEVKMLYPQLEPAAAWADSLEALAARRA